MRLAELAERGETDRAEYASEARKARLFGMLSLLLVTGAIFLMVAKPGV